MRHSTLRGPCFPVTLAGAVLAPGCGSLGTPPPGQVQSLEVSLLQVESPTDYVVQLTNTGNVPVAVCPCIGPPNRFIVFDLCYEDEDRKVGYPEILYSGGRMRRFYHCLEAGESLRGPVDLRRWEPVWHQQREPYPPIDLLVGPGSYRLRARYIDSGRVARRRCSSFQGQAASQWKTFEVRE